MGNNRGSQTEAKKRAKTKNYAHDNLLKETEKQLWLKAMEGQKAARQRKHNDWKKERRLLHAPILTLQKGKISKLIKV